uniref:Phosphorylated adapter RNA export protein n=1 Tax=Chenopodium quinoa TaxID=63459 RepID=A0A803LBE7_CHEQI
MESILDTIDEELSFGDGEDVEMMDIEEGEVVDGHVSGETSDKNDIEVKVEAVQVCGGQKTVLGDRYRSGGGVLWNILKARDPNAYKEIMKKGRDFEKQFRRPSVQPPSASDAMTGKPVASTSDNDCEIETPVQEQLPQPSAGEKRVPVHERIRVPVSYDDLPVEEPANDQSS